MDRQQQFRRSARPMLLVDGTRRIVDANRVACLLLRLSRAEVTALALDDLVPETERPQLTAALALIEGSATAEDRPEVAAGERPPVTLALLMPDGGRLVVDLRCLPNVSEGVHLLTLDFPATGIAPEPSADQLLTDRERQVLTQVALGRTGQAIAADLFLSPATVESHVSHALTKLQARNRPHGVALALRRGEIDANAFAVPRGMVGTSASDAGDREQPPDLGQVTIDSLDDPIAVVGEDGTILAVNERWRRVAEQHHAAGTTGPGTSYLEACDRAVGESEDAAEAAWGLREILEGRIESFLTEYSVDDDAGERRWFEARAVRYRGDGPPRVVIRHHDVTAQRQVEVEARITRSLLDEVDSAVVLSSLDGIVTRWKAGAERLYGWTEEEALGRPLGELTLELREAALFRASIKAVLREGHWSGELRMRPRDGRPFEAFVRHGLIRNGGGKPTGIVSVSVDVSAKLQAQRALLSTRECLRVVAASMEEGLVTLDAFGLVTDVNPAATRMLGWTADELRGTSMHEAISMLSGPPAPGRAGRLLRVPAEEFRRRDGTTLAVSYTAAPYDAGDGASGSVVVFRDTSAQQQEQSLLQHARTTARILRKIRDALDEDRFVLQAQAIVDLQTGVAVRYELLPRIAARGGGLISAGQFVPIAREHGLLRRIDRWLLDRAVRVAGHGVAVEVRLSPESVSDPTLLPFVESLLRPGRDEDLEADAVTTSGEAFPAPTGTPTAVPRADQPQAADPSAADPDRPAPDVAPALLTFGVTEAALRSDEVVARTFVRRVTELGCRTALEDFGSGYAGIAHLRELPWSAVKIDVAFVAELREDGRSHSIVRAIVELARGFGLDTVAEGVEDESTREMLVALHVDLAQGQLLGRPLPVDEVVRQYGRNGAAAG